MDSADFLFHYPIIKSTAIQYTKTHNQNNKIFKQFKHKASILSHNSTPLRLLYRKLLFNWIMSKKIGKKKEGEGITKGERPYSKSGLKIQNDGTHGRALAPSSRSLQHALLFCWVISVSFAWESHSWVVDGLYISHGPRNGPHCTKLYELGESDGIDVPPNWV